MHVAYLGNFSVSHSTESHVAASLESLSHSVTRIQEGQTRAVNVPLLVHGHDLFLWTQTKSLADQGGNTEERMMMVAAIRGMGIPSLGFHLDRWWGLKREGSLYTEPFFRLDYLATAEGGVPEKWKALGVNHIWAPPAVFHEETALGTPRSEFESDIVFVGSWQAYGHTEWKHRQELINHLQRRWKGRVAFWPKPGQPAVRGKALQDLYASVKVAIGDSCLSPVDGKPVTRYFSDRIPETVGRGCALIHPYVEGVTDGTLYEDCEHLVTWPLGDWESLDRAIEGMLRDDAAREHIAKQGWEHVQERHTYRVRMAEILEEIGLG